MAQQKMKYNRCWKKRCSKQLLQILDGRLELGVIKTNQRDEASPKEVCSGIPQFIIGVKGLAGFLGTSVSTVNRWKACGLLDDATLQCGKVVIFELPKVIEILRVSDKKNKFNVKS